MHCSRSATAAIAGMALIASAACKDSTAPQVITPVTAQLTVDATQSTAYVHVDGATAQSVTVGDPTTSTAWDMAFNASLAVNTNGGGSGPGTVAVYCLCLNASATTAQVQAMTSDNQLAAFNAVTSAQIPVDGSFTSDVFGPATNGWYTGTGTSAVVAPGQLIVLRNGTTSVTFTKFHVTALGTIGATGPASITIEYATEATPGGAFGATTTATIPAGGYFTFSIGAAGTASAWDIKLDGWNIRANGGVSGTGSVAAVSFPNDFASLGLASLTNGIPASAYTKDGLTSVFNTTTGVWYKYNITGNDHQIWPLYNVYLVKRGTSVWKVQITSYYNAAAAPGYITLRYAQLR